MTPRFLLGLLASFVLLCSGCKEAAATGGTSGVALYAYDSTSSAVFVWADLSAHETSQPTRPETKPHRPFEWRR